MWVDGGIGVMCLILSHIHLLTLGLGLSGGANAQLISVPDSVLS